MIMITDSMGFFKPSLISELHKYNLQIYKNTNYSNTEIQNTKLKNYNLQKCRNTIDRITEIQVNFEL